jgi:hypothetical protein
MNGNKLSAYSWKQLSQGGSSLRGIQGVYYRHTTMYPALFVLTTKFHLFLIIYKLTFRDHMDRGKTFVITPSGSTYTIWQFVMFLVLL